MLTPFVRVQALYAQLGVRSALVRACHDLPSRIELRCDGQLVDLPRTGLEGFRSFHAVDVVVVSVDALSATVAGVSSAEENSRAQRILSSGGSGIKTQREPTVQLFCVLQTLRDFYASTPPAFVPFLRNHGKHHCLQHQQLRWGIEAVGGRGTWITSAEARYPSLEHCFGFAVCSFRP